MGKKRILFFAYLLLFTIFLSFNFAGITKENPLTIGQTLNSSNGVYELGFFSFNNSPQHQYVGIWFKDIIPQVVVWVANREKPVTDSTANLGISSNGSLLLSDGKNGVVWSIGDIFASNVSSAELILIDTGNLVFRDKVSESILWQSFEHLGNTLLPTSKMIYNIVTGENRGLSSWTSCTDPSPGDFTVYITSQMPAQGFVMRGSASYYRTGPWAKTRYTGLPEMDDSYTSPFILEQDSNGSGYFSYFDPYYKLSRIVLTSEGSMKVLRHNGRDWESSFEGPANPCDIYGVCGPFGYCVTSVPPKCECFKGFVPKSIEEWRRGIWTRGCVRRTELHCRENSTSKDGNVFYTVSNIKPPDFYEYEKTVDAEECKQNCFHNCSCVAFANIPGIGCLTWSKDLLDTRKFSAGGEVISIRLARSELDVNNRKKTIVATTVSLTLFAILGFAAFVFWRCRLEHNAHISQDAWRNDLKSQDVPGLEFFEINTIQIATNDFSPSNKLGHGGFGSVYKGILQDGREIAVKRLSSSSGQGKEEFMNEIVLISKLQHRNLVKVLGCCVEGNEKLLIYEFMKNKSLDTFVFDSSKKLEIDWPKRFDIILGIARGLLYLHRDSRLKVIHRDLKVSNILLDEKMNPKISDFGLARMFEGTQYQDKTRRVVGTLGYMSPEYAWTGVFSEKSDIYSFGVLLLEIISGEKISRFSYGEEGKGLLAYVWECWCEMGGFNLLDRDVAYSGHPSEIGRCVQIGLLCVQHQPADRPNTLELLSMLTTTSELPLPNQPTYAVHTKDEKPTYTHSMITGNEMTESVVQGR